MQSAFCCLLSKLVVAFQVVPFQTVAIQIAFQIVTHFTFINTAVCLVLFRAWVVLRIATCGTLSFAGFLVVTIARHTLAIASDLLTISPALLLVRARDLDEILVGHNNSP